MSDSLLEFSEDIRGLYLKTGIKEIEDGYISLMAARADNISDVEIIKWIQEAYPAKISDPKISKALKLLPSINADDLMNRWNAWLLENTKFPSQFATPKKDFEYAGEFIGYYIVFSKLLGNPNAGLLLRPFENILKFFGSQQVVEQVGEAVTRPDDFTVFHDLTDLQNSFLQQKEQKEKVSGKNKGKMPKEEYGTETKQEKKQNLYDDLYDWLSEDFTKAAQNMGYTDLAEKIDKGGVLGNIGVLQEYIKQSGLSDDFYIREPSPIHAELLEDIVKFITKPSNLNRYLKPENHIEAYQEIKEYIMRMAGQVTAEQISKTRQERKKQKLIPSRTKEMYYETETQESPELPLADDAWMNGTVMSFMSAVLAELYYKFNL